MGDDRRHFLHRHPKPHHVGLTACLREVTEGTGLSPLFESPPVALDDTTTFAHIAKCRACRRNLEEISACRHAGR